MSPSDGNAGKQAERQGRRMLSFIEKAKPPAECGEHQKEQVG